MQLPCKVLKVPQAVVASLDILDAARQGIRRCKWVRIKGISGSDRCPRSPALL